MLDFDRLYLVEWDLLLVEPLERLYSHVPSEAIAVTARFPLNDVAHNWGWMKLDRYRRQWDEMLSFVKREYAYEGDSFASLGPGTCFSRSFIEKYCEVRVPELTCDELRAPLFAQCFGIPVCDTLFRASWDDPEDLQFFNCQDIEIPIGAIRSEMARAQGRRAFHPFRQLFLDIAG